MLASRQNRPGPPLQAGREPLYPRLKVAGFAVFIVSLFFVQGISLQAIAAGAVVVVALMTLSPGRLKGGLFPIAFFLLFTFAGNLFFHSGKILYGIGPLSVTDEGIHLAGVRTLRVFSMIGAAKILTGTLSVDELVRSLEEILKPLERIGIPVKDFFSIMGLTMQSFPALMTYLLKEYRQHMNDREVRGIRQRMGLVASFLMPVFVRSIQSPESFFVSPDPPGPSRE